MGKRNTGRKLAMKALYQAELQKVTIEEINKDYLIKSRYLEDTKNWAINLSQGTWSKLTELDQLISTYAVGWSLKRINPIDKSILRIAFYELLETDTPVQIVINEALEIAKKYSTDDSPKFINGILGKYVENVCSQDSSKK